LLKCPGNLSF